MALTYKKDHLIHCISFPAFMHYFLSFLLYLNIIITIKPWQHIVRFNVGQQFLLALRKQFYSNDNGVKYILMCIYSIVNNVW